MSVSKIASWAFFSASMGILAFVAWNLLAGSGREGTWEPRLTGTAVGELPAYGFTGEIAAIEHPAVLYFFRRDCRFCAPAAQRLDAFLASTSADGLPVFAITNEWDLPNTYASSFRSRVNVVRLSRTMPRLSFVEYLPLLVRTDATGSIEAAYVGVPGPEVLAEILTPRGAGPGAR